METGTLSNLAALWRGKLSLEDSAMIDIVAKSLDSVANGMELLLVDSGEVTDEELRYRLVVDKLANYVNYAISAEFAAAYPATTTDKVLICVLCVNPPNGSMEQIQAVRPRGDERRRIRVSVELREDFQRRYLLAS